MKAHVTIVPETVSATGRENIMQYLGTSASSDQKAALLAGDYDNGFRPAMAAFSAIEELVALESDIMGWFWANLSRKNAGDFLDRMFGLQKTAVAQEDNPPNNLGAQVHMVDGVRVARFADTANRLYRGDVTGYGTLTGSNSVTVVLAQRVTSDVGAGNDRFPLVIRTGGVTVLQYGLRSLADRVTFRRVASDDLSVVTGDANTWTALNTWAIVEFSLSFANLTDNVVVRHNGAVTSTYSAGVSTGDINWEDIAIAVGGTSLSATFPGDIAEIMILKKALSTAERTAIYASMRARNPFLPA